MQICVYMHAEDDVVQQNCFPYAALQLWHLSDACWTSGSEMRKSINAGYVIK